MHGNIKDISGNRYGNLVVLELADLELETHRGAVWKCRCDCGNICYKSSTHLQDTRNKTMSCGCMSKRNYRFPNKFVEKKSHKNAKERFAEQLLDYFKDAPFYEELKNGINETLKGE